MCGRRETEEGGSKLCLSSGGNKVKSRLRELTLTTEKLWRSLNRQDICVHRGTTRWRHRDKAPPASSRNKTGTDSPLWPSEETNQLESCTSSLQNWEINISCLSHTVCSRLSQISGCDMSLCREYMAVSIPKLENDHHSIFKNLGLLCKE